MAGFREAALNLFRGIPAEEAANLKETTRQYGDSMELLQERLAELELSLEDAGWQRLSGESDKEFSRGGLRSIALLARLYWLKNPLIKRAVFIQQSYVMGQGLSVSAKHPAVNEVIQGFWNDKKNQVELTSQQALSIKEAELQVQANLFFCFFVNVSTGAVRVRTIPFDEIEEVITNPDDAKEPWYYKRIRVKKVFNPNTGEAIGQQETSYHPDWRYKPDFKPPSIAGAPVVWDAPVYHVAVNKLSDMRFGVSEVYAAIDWAKAYKDFLQDWATIVRSYARFAWQVTTKGGRAGVAAAKTKLNTALTSTNGVDSNPPPAAGGAFVATEGVSMTPIRTAGATTDAEDGRRLLLMVCAATGIYEHYFGDPSTGNLASTKSMERPMELMFLERRNLWSSVIGAILDYVVEASARAANGKLSGGTVELDDYGEERIVLPLDEETNEPMSRLIDVDFPPLLEKDVLEHIQAIISAGTLDGKTPAGIDLKTMTKMLLVALGEDDIGEMLEELFPEGWEEERAQKASELAKAAQAGVQQGQTPKEVAADESLREAVHEFREALMRFADA